MPRGLAPWLYATYKQQLETNYAAGVVVDDQIVQQLVFLQHKHMYHIVQVGGWGVEFLKEWEAPPHVVA